MQVVVETLKNLERRIKVTVPAEQVDNEVGSRLLERKKTIKLKGFRPGKVPLDLIKQQYGDSIRQEVIGEVIRSSFNEAVAEQNLKPAGYPQIEPKVIETGVPLEYEATFEVYPQISLVDLTGVKLEKRTGQVTEADVDKVLEKLRKQNVIWNEAPRQSRTDDRLLIDFEGMMDGVAFPGGSAKDAAMVLGAKGMIPGFEEGLIAKTAGEEVELNLVFPEDYPHKDVAGKPVSFKVKINKVMEPQLPELDDKFAKNLDVANLQELRQEVRKSMERELERAQKEHLKQQVLDHLLERNPIEIPNALIDAEILQMQQQFMQRVTGKPVARDKIPNLPREHFEEQAKKRVRLGLLLAEYINEKKLKPEPERVQKLVEEVASAYDNPAQIAAYYYQNKAQLAQIESLVLEELAVEKLLETAQVEEKSAKYDEIVTTQSQ